MNYLNIGIDDVSPHPRSSLSILKNCEKILSKHPKVKFSLFVPVAYWRTKMECVSTRNPLFLSEHEDFCESLKNLSKKTYEIGYHGYHHGIPYVSDNDEFRNMDFKESKDRYKLMFDEVKKAGLTNVFKKIFRPPAWRMSPESFDSGREMSIEIFALSDLDYALSIYKGKDLEKNDVVYSNMFPPEKPLFIQPHMCITYHACDWVKNFLNDQNTSELISFLDMLKDDVEFCFMKEMLHCGNI